MTDDAAVISTNDDATSCKFSAVKLGYFQDEFVQFFAKSADRRPPIINRGYYTRVALYRKVIHNFLANGGSQIVSLGGGFDTNYFTLMEHHKDILPADLLYVELDFPEVVLNKTSIIRKRNKLSSLIGDAQYLTAGGVVSKHYVLLGGDLRDIMAIERKLVGLAPKATIDFTKPTLFLSECVLIYLTVEQACEVIHWASTKFTNSGILIYEQILPHDGFGKTMVKNLQARGCPLLTLMKYPTLDAQAERFKSLGFPMVEAMDMNDVWKKQLDHKDTQRIVGIELFDELEEWHLIQGHYCVVLAMQISGQVPVGDNVWTRCCFQNTEVPQTEIVAEAKSFRRPGSPKLA